MLLLLFLLLFASAGAVHVPMLIKMLVTETRDDWIHCSLFTVICLSTCTVMFLLSLLIFFLNYICLLLFIIVIIVTIASAGAIQVRRLSDADKNGDDGDAGWSVVLQGSCVVDSCQWAVLPHCQLLCAECWRATQRTWHWGLCVLLLSFKLTMLNSRGWNIEG